MCNVWQGVGKHTSLAIVFPLNEQDYSCFHLEKQQLSPHRLTWFLPAALGPSYQPPLRAVRRNAVMGFLCSDCDWEKHREHTDLDSLPGSQLACVALSTPPPPSFSSFLPLSPCLPPPCNILLSVTGLYKTLIVQSLYLEAMCEERKLITLEVLCRHRPEVWSLYFEGFPHLKAKIIKT